MSPSPTSRQGAAAEILAGEYLERHGLIILERNLSCRMGELDLVCLDAGVLVIVEVRQRGRLDFGGAQGSVTRRKQLKLARAALYYWQRRPEWRDRILRFDVIAFEGAPGAAQRTLWIKDAFRAAS